MAPRSRRARAGLVAAVVTLGLLAACSAEGSGDSGSPTTEADDVRPTTTADGGDDAATGSEQAYIQAVTDAMRKVEDSDFPIDDEQAGCLAPRWVDAIGYETLLDAGVTPEVLGGAEDGATSAEFEDVVDRARAEKLVDAFGQCGIDLEEYFYGGLTSDGSATPEQAECLRDRLPKDYIRRLMITSMDGGDDALDADPDLEDQLTEAFMACLAEG